MVAQEDQAQRYSIEEWRELLKRSEVKYEYHHGWVIAMAGGHCGPCDNRRKCLSAAPPCLGWNTMPSLQL